MEPLTAGAIAFVTLLLNKTFEKTGEIIVAKAFEKENQVIDLMKNQSPDTVTAIEVAAEKETFPPREDFGEAILVEMVELAAKANPDIKAALTDLATKLDKPSLPARTNAKSKVSQPAKAGFVCVDAVSTAQLTIW